MSLRRLHPDQPKSFAFTPANQVWAEAQLTKYPEGRQASAVIPLLWRGQEQEGWITRPMIENIAKMLDLAPIRVLEVASFYFMFQLQPVGSVAHIQVCGTTSCMICGAEDLIGVCKEKIAANPHQISEDGKFSWEEVECLGACSNAPMAQIGKDFYEDLTAENFSGIIDAFARGETPTPGPQNGRYAAEPLPGLTSLKIPEADRNPDNRSMELARLKGDTVGRVLAEIGPDGAEITGDALSPWRDAVGGKGSAPAPAKPKAPAAKPEPAKGAKTASPAQSAPPAPVVAKADDAVGEPSEEKPQLFTSRPAEVDDLKLIKGVGPKLEGVLHELGIYQFAQISVWTESEIAWVDGRLKFKGRIERDDWINQARILSDGGTTEFADRNTKGDKPVGEK